MGKGDPEREEREANLKIIADLMRAYEELASKKKKSWELEEIITEAKVLAREWTIKEPDGRRSLLFDGTALPGTILVAALVVALRRYQELVERIHRRFPNELRQLDDASRFAEYDDLIDALRLMKWNHKLKKWQKLTKDQRYERGRNEVPRAGYGLIGDQFGELRLGGVRPTCLDRIFAGKSVSMIELIELFGVERHRLLELAVEKRRYTYLSIVEIMNKLLEEPVRQKRKRSKPGAPRRAPWLNDQDLRERVLDEIPARLNNLSVSQKIKAKFEEVLRSYSGQSGKK